MNMIQNLGEKFLNLKIMYKFLFALIVFVIGMTAIGYFFYSAFNLNQQTVTATQKHTQLLSLNHIVVNEINHARLYEKDFRLLNQESDREAFKKSLLKASQQLNQLNGLLNSAAEKKNITTLKSLLAEYERTFLSATASESDLPNEVTPTEEKPAETPAENSEAPQQEIPIENLEKGEPQAIAEKTPARLEQLPALVDKILLELKAFEKIAPRHQQQFNTQIEASFQQAQLSFWIVIGIAPLMIVGVSWLVLVQGVIRPLSYLQSILNEITAGNLDARADSSRKDEIGNLSNAFDSLLDERVTSLAKTEYEHQQLNSSIISLLRSVSVLSQKDLTVKVPVAEDMTGAVSDSINLLTDEMSTILKGVADISKRVNDISSNVKQQSSNVMLFADNQHQEINETLDELNTAVNTMIKIAKFSQVTNKESEKTMLTTESAEEAVAKTITSINAIRDIIRETEKRIKRLGERSQEITAVVNIIDNIAERTHVLSLNAGMQAASAGEAGKGFMVVANEVQRLAESSREATEKIATLVKNIQVDTSDTMKTMNNVISQVVDGTQQAEEAGRRMKESRAITQSLVTSVKKIAVTTIAQLEVGKSLKEHAQNIQKSTIKTNEQLQQQRTLSDDLAQDADELLVKVNVFKLPD